MFKKKKKPEPLLEALKNPPRVVKEFKTLRIVVREVPEKRIEDGETILWYRKERVLQARNINAMEEPFWQDEIVVNENGHSSPTNYSFLGELINQIEG